MKAIEETLYQCWKCNQYYHQRSIAEGCCTDEFIPPGKKPHKCKCGTVLDYDIHTVCEKCREKNRYEKAEKVTEWGGWIFADGIGGNDGFFESVGDLIEYIEDYSEPGEEMPTYVYTCTKVSFQVDIQNAIESASENFEELPWTLEEDLDELKETINEWNKAQKACSYTPNYKKVLLLK